MWEHTRDMAAAMAPAHTVGPGSMPAMPPTALERAIADGYPLDLRDVLGDALRHLKGSKRVIVGGALTWLAISVLVGWITLALGMGNAPSGALGVLATAPLTVGLVMVGARRAAGHAITPADLWAYRGVTAHAAIVMLVNLLVVVGSEALLGPVASLPLTIVYGLFTSLALYLVADRGLSGGRAILASAQLVRHRWAALLLLQLLLAGLLALSVLTLGIGLIWTGPFAVLAQGAVYVRAVGLADAGGQAERWSPR
jgi:hypothetical protein